MNNSEKFFGNSSFTGKVSIPEHLGRWKDTDVSLLLKGTKKDVFETIAEQFTKGMWSFGEAIERGL